MSPIRNDSLSTAAVEKRVAVIGGGIAGCMTALEFSKDKELKIDLYEKNDEILMGPPFCHLHAGGMLYPMISSDQQKELLRQSVDFALMFNDCINQTPTVVAYNIHSSYTAEDLTEKCKYIQREYAEYIETNKLKPILGSPKDYYSLYYESDVKYFIENSHFETAQVHDVYVSSFLNSFKKFEEIKYPFACVNEFGIEMASVKKRVKELLVQNNISIFTRTNVKNLAHNSYEKKWSVQIDDIKSKYDYVVNACGYESAKLTKTIPDHSAFLEIKASWIIKVDSNHVLPEVAIIGERGTKNGMVQLTPHKKLDNSFLYQIHVMTEDVTLFPDGCQSEKKDVYQSWNSDTLREISKRKKLPLKMILERTAKAVDYVQVYFKGFDKYTTSVDAMWGIQRIVSESKDFRSGNFNVYRDCAYGEVNIVKGMSSVTIAKAVVKELK